MAEEEVAEGAEGGEASPVTKKDEAAAPSGGEGKSNKLITILLLVNALALIGFAALAWMTHSRRMGEASLAEVKTSAETVKEVAPASEGDKAKPEDLIIKESFTANLKDPKGRHFAKIDVEIEVPDAFVKEEVNRLRPKIRDFILNVLTSKTFEEVESLDGRNFLKEEIRNKINGYLARGEIRNVYFTQFIIQ